MTPANMGMDNWYQFPEISSVVKCKRVDLINRALCEKVLTMAEHLDDDDEVGRVRATAAWSFLRMNEVLGKADWFLTDDEVAEFQRAARLFLKSLVHLSNIDRWFVWKLRPKHHQLSHIIIEIERTRLNPLRITCLLEEDFLGEMKKIVLPLRGLSLVSLMQRIFDRYLLMLILRWKKTQRSWT